MTIYTVDPIKAQYLHDTYICNGRSVSTESLVIGALETAFWEADQLIGEEKKVYHMTGGCTVLVALFILGNIFR